MFLWLVVKKLRMFSEMCVCVCESASACVCCFINVLKKIMFKNLNWILFWEHF